MKKLFTIFLLCIFAHAISYAGGLEFSQVLNLQGNFGTSTTVTIGTVPPGKAWKLVNMTTQDAYLYVQGAANQFSLTYSNDVRITNNQYVTSTSQPGYMTGTIWFQEGQVIMGSGSNASDWYYLSILEFDVLP